MHPNFAILSSYPAALAAVLRDREYNFELALMDVEEDWFGVVNGWLHRSDRAVWSGVWIPALDQWVDCDDRETLRAHGVPR